MRIQEARNEISNISYLWNTLRIWDLTD